MMSVREENPSGVPEALMSDMGRTRGGGVQTQCVGLLVDAGKAVNRGA